MKNQQYIIKYLSRQYQPRLACAGLTRQALRHHGGRSR